MTRKEYEDLISSTILNKRRDVVFYVGVKGTPKIDGSIECDEIKIFHNIFELVDFVNNLKDSEMVGYHNIDNNESNLLIYIRKEE